MANRINSKERHSMFFCLGKKPSTQSASGNTATSKVRIFSKVPELFAFLGVAKIATRVYHPSRLHHRFLWAPRFIGTMGVTHSQHALIKPHVLHKTWRCRALEISQDGTVSISKPNVLIQLISSRPFPPTPTKKRTT